jgi:hypothetical protein
MEAIARPTAVIRHLGAPTVEGADHQDRPILFPDRVFDMFLLVLERNSPWLMGIRREAL